MHASNNIHPSSNSNNNNNNNNNNSNNNSSNNNSKDGNSGDMPGVRVVETGQFSRKARWEIMEYKAEVRVPDIVIEGVSVNAQVFHVSLLRATLSRAYSLSLSLSLFCLSVCLSVFLALFVCADG